MTTETVTDYKTVEKTREVRRCDGPGCSLTDEETNLVSVCINPKITKYEKEDIEPIKVCEGVEQRDYELRKKRKAENIPPASEDAFGLKPAIGRKTTQEVVDVDSSGKIDLCEDCVGNFFDAEIDEPDGFQIMDKEVRAIKKVERKYPTPNVWEGSSLFNFLSIIGWPITLLLFCFTSPSSLFAFEQRKNKNESFNAFINTRFIEVSIGMALYIFAFYLFTFLV